MGLKTRLDGRSQENNSFKIKDAEGREVAEIKLLDPSGVTIEVATEDGLFIQKPNGWSSQRN